MRAIDLFAGWGGFTEGATQAGLDVVWAANHWQLAVDAHAKNHPGTKHVCQDLRQANWATVPDYELLLASPACQGHSQAAQPSRARSERTRRTHDALRSTALAIIDCVDQTRPKALIVENVPDFKKWGKVPGDGKMYAWWCQGLELLGYKLAELRLIASHFGVPQRRDRLFVVGVREDLKMPNLDFVKGAEPGFGDSCQWETGTWSRIADHRYPMAKARLQIASERFGLSMVQHVTGHKGLPVTDPIRTITKQDQWHLVKGDLHRLLTIRETARAMGFRDDYGWPSYATRGDMIDGLGNAVCPPVARALIERLAA